MDDLKPIGFFIDNNNPSKSVGVYFKDEIMNFLLYKSNNDQQQADKMYQEYWDKNNNIMIIIKSEHTKETYKKTIKDDISNNINFFKNKINELKQL